MTPTALERWFFAPAPLHPMIVARVLTGSALFGAYLMRIPEISLLYGAESVAWSEPYHFLVEYALQGEAVFTLAPLVSLLSGLDPGIRDPLVYGGFALLLASAASFTLGLFTRAAGICAIGLHLFFVSLNPLSFWGWAQMAPLFTLYAVLAPSGRYFSLDALRARRPAVAVEDWKASAWPLRLLQVHIALLYAYAGLSRIDHPGWQQGQMLFELMNHPMHGRLPLGWFAFRQPFEALSYCVLLLEPAAVVLLFVPRVRVLCALALIAMHLTLELFSNVGWWNHLTLAGLLAFLPPTWLIAAFRALTSRFRTASVGASP